jgi:hypothetical protein
VVVMNKTITVMAPDNKVKTVINTESITHLFIHPDNKVILIMAGGAKITIEDGEPFLSHLRKLYPEMVGV